MVSHYATGIGASDKLLTVQTTACVERSEVCIRVCVNIQALKITLVDSFLSLNQMQSKLSVYRTSSGTITPQKIHGDPPVGAHS